MAGGSLAEDGGSQELAALVERALLDDLVRPPQHRRRDRQPERLRGLEIDDQLELGRLCTLSRVSIIALPLSHGNDSIP